MPAFNKYPEFNIHWKISILLIFMMGVYPAGSCKASDTAGADKLQRVADSLFEIKKYDEAITTYKQAALMYHAQNVWDHEVICINGEANALRKLRKYDRAIERFNSAIDLGLIHLDGINAGLATSFHLKALCYWAKGDYYQVVFLEQMAIKRWKLIFGEQSFQVAKGLNNIGLCYKNMGKYDKSIDRFKNALKIFTHELDSLDPRIASVMNNISFAYQKIGDYDQALAFSKKAIASTLRHQPVDSLSLMKKYNNLGLLYYNMGNSDLAQEYLEKGLTLRLKYLDKMHPDIADTYNNLGMISRTNGHADDALAYYQKALRIYKNIYNDHHPDVAMCYNNIGNAYKEKQEYKKALDYYDRALSIRLATYHEHHPDIALCYLNFGSVYKTMGDYDKALEFLDKALDGNTYKDQIIDSREQLDILHEKAAVYFERYQMKNQDTSDLSRAVEVYKSICLLIDEQRKSYHSKGSMLALGNAVSDIYKEAVEVAYKLYLITNNPNHLNDAFYFTEKNKANVLVESILESRSQSYSGILDSLIDKEKNMKQKLQICDEQRKDEIFNKGKRNPEKIKKLESEFTRLSQSYDSLIVIFEKNHERYYRLRYNTSTLSAVEVQKMLAGNEAVVEYMISDSLLFIFTITPDQIALANSNTNDLDSAITNLRQSISNLSIDKLNNHSTRNYCDNASRLFKVLIKPVEDKIAGKDLIIVPDGKLGYIPFEVLLADSIGHQPINFKDLPYLVKKYSISYANSASIQFDLLNSLHCDASENFLGMAPFAHAYTESSSTARSDTFRLSELPSSKQEVESIHKLMGGRVYEDSSATLENFLHQAKTFKILHIATHGDVNDEHPLESCLYFYQGVEGLTRSLKIKDLFGLSFNSEMAVLSACNTGIGKLEGGEGIMSLARGFSYAGIPAITMSLWNVNDQSTAIIMDGFYNHLKSGYTKNKALQLAKLNYLEQADKLLASPYYWSGFIFIGKNDEIGLNNTAWNYWLLLILIPATGVVIYFIKRKNLDFH